MQNLISAIVAIVLGVLAYFGSVLIGEWFFLSFIEPRGFRNAPGFLAAQALFIWPFLVSGVVLGMLVAALLKTGPLLWATVSGSVATVIGFWNQTVIYFLPTPLWQRVLSEGRPAFLLLGAIAGAVLFIWLRRLTKGSTGRRVSAEAAKPGESGGGAG